MYLFGRPVRRRVAATRHHEPDAIVAMADGRVVDCGAAREVSARLPAGTPVVAYANALITAGFIDGHVHYPQIPVIGAGGKSLLDWLADYTFPMERRFADADYAREVANVYLAENLRHGITTAAVFGTVHPASVDVFFEEAQALGLRMIAGKVMMAAIAPRNSGYAAGFGRTLDGCSAGMAGGACLRDHAALAVTSSHAQLEARGR